MHTPQQIQTFTFIDATPNQVTKAELLNVIIELKTIIREALEIIG